MTQPKGQEGEEDEDSIDDEEEGGEWITQENLHKHLTHGLMLPIVPVEQEEGTELVQPDRTNNNLESVQEAIGEEENPDFPAFDEAQLPSMDELDRKKAQIDSEEAKESQSEAAQ